MQDLFDHIEEARRAIQARWPGQPRIGIILGTGLGGLVQEIKAEAVLPYEQIPHFSQSTVASHAGQLVCGRLAGKVVAAMEGRFHAYEGYSLGQITFPVRVMKALGCEVLIVSNACGAMNPQYGKGDLMVIEDHINLIGDNPLVGKNDERLGPRFPDMCRAYDRELIALTQRVALEEKIVCHKGVYVAVPGPNLETRAEYRFLRAIGADVVGMSTVPEVIVGVHCGLRNLGLSVITDMCLPDALEPVALPEILATASAAEKQLRRLVRRIIEEDPMNRNFLAVLFAMTFPTIMAWLYFVVLATQVPDVPAADHAPQRNPIVMVALAGSKLFQFALPALWVFGVQRRQMSWPRVSWDGILAGLAFGFVVGGGLLGVYYGLVRSGRSFPTAILAHQVSLKVHEYSLETPAAYLAFAVFLAAVHSFLEEYYWRWFVFGQLREMISWGKAQALSSVAFMAHHVIILWVYLPGKFWQLAMPMAAGVAVGGAFWAWLYQRSGSIWAPCLSHLLIDAAIMIVGYDLVFVYQGTR